MTIKLASIVFAGFSLCALGACADYYEGGYAAGYGTPYYNDGYYDGFYGQPYGGYWGGDGFFYYQTGPSAGYVRDEGRHFRRDASPGYNSFHMRDQGGHGGAPQAGGGPNWGRHRDR